MTSTFTDPVIAALDAQGATSGTMADATAIINQYLSDYGLQSLSNWAWGEITNGASSDQVLVDLQQTPQYQARFPGIVQRQKAGLPPISPSDYISYEDTAKQIENTYGLPTGFLTDPARIGSLIGGDTSLSELSDRAEKGYQAVAASPAATRQAFAAQNGINGDGALAAYFMDPKYSVGLLERQATAADLAGTASQSGVNIGSSLATQMAEAGLTGSSAQQGFSDLAKQQPLFDTAAGDQDQSLTESDQGVKAEFGLDAQAQQDVIARQQQRQSAFKGGGAPSSDQYGVEGAGATRSY